MIQSVLLLLFIIQPDKADYFGEVYDYEASEQPIVYAVGDEQLKYNSECKYGSASYEPCAVSNVTVLLVTFVFQLAFANQWHGYCVQGE